MKNKIKNISINDIVIINDVEHVCIMANSYGLNNPKTSFRFTNKKLPKSIRHQVYNEYYYNSEDDLLKDIENEKIKFSISNQKYIETKQLAFF